LFFSPILFFPDSARYLIHDNIDSNLVWYKNLSESGVMFSGSSAKIDNLMLGIPRDCYPSEWAIDRMMYLIFSPQWAFSLNYIIMHLVAFIGMRALIKNTFSNSSNSVYNLVALAFALLPFWPSGFLSVAGLPLLANALIQIFKKKSSIVSWLIVAIFPLTGTLVFGNLFSLSMFFLFYLFGVLKQEWKINFNTIAPFVLLFFVTYFVEHRIINLAVNGFESNRSLDVPNVVEYMNINGIFGTSILAFLFSHYHFHALQSFIVIVTLVFIFWSLINKRVKEVQFLIGLLGFILALCFLMVFLDNYDLRVLFGNNYKRFELRFWVLFPLFWYLIFAIVLLKLQRHGYKKWVRVLLSIQVIYNLFLLYPKDYFGSRYAENIFANTYIFTANTEQEKFKTYFRVSDFDSLKKYLPDYKTKHFVAIGINPEILQYNGFNTLEGYYSYYPIYKRLLVKSVDSLERHKNNNYFEKHSNRNYLYIHEKNSTNIPKWNYELLKERGVNYLIVNHSFQDDYLKWNLIVSVNGLKLYKLK
jgi:hypothetical protein